MIRRCAGVALWLVAAGAAAEVVPEVLRGVEARSAALLLSGQRGGTLSAALTVGPILSDTGSLCRLDVWLEVDGPSLLAGNRAGTAEVEVATYVMAGSGRVNAFERVLLRLGVELLGDRLRQGMRLHRCLRELPCARQTVRVLLLDRGSGDFYLGEAMAWVAGAGWSAQVVASAEERIEIADGCSAAAARPALRPTATPGSPLRLALYPPHGAHLGGVVLGRLVGDEATPMTQVAPAGPGDGRFLLEWQVPSTARPGRRELELLLVGDAGEEIIVQVPVWVVGEREDALETAPLGLAENLSSGPEALALPAANDLHEAYLEVLRQSVREEGEKALQAAEGLYRRALSRSRGAGESALRRTIVGVAGRLAQQDWATLPSLLWLHCELYQRLAAAGAGLHAAVAAEQLESLAALCDPRRCPEEVRGIVARLLTDLAEAQARRGAWQAARRLFQRVLALAPDLQLARIGAAAVAEWLGEYQEAVSVLRPVEKATAVEGEVLLRLGVNLRRLGERLEAGAVLRRCAEREGPEWVRVAALEELAQMELAAGRATAAATMLTAAVAALPGYPSLRLLLGQALEESGDLTGAKALFSELSRGASGKGKSPRLRYTRGEEPAIAGCGEEVRLAGQRARPALATALGLGEEQ